MVEVKPEKIHRPIKLTPVDKQLIEKNIGINSPRHGVYFLWGSGHEIEYLSYIALTYQRDRAVKKLMSDYDLPEAEARAVTLFCKAFPETVKEEGRRRYDLFPETRRVAQANPLEELKLKRFVAEPIP